MRSLRVKGRLCLIAPTSHLEPSKETEKQLEEMKLPFLEIRTVGGGTSCAFLAASQDASNLIPGRLNSRLFSVPKVQV